MSEGKAFRLGIIALGGISSSAHGPAIERSKVGIEIVACCDIRPEAVKDWTAIYGGAGYTDYIEMIRKEKLDGVLLATWPNQHREQIEKLLAAGVKNILCEKALALAGREAAAIYESVSKAGAFLMEGFMYRHSPVIRKLEQLLATGRLGAIDSVRACFSAFDAEGADASNPDRNWRQRKECGGGIPYDFACYCVNACGHFAAKIPKRVYCAGGIGKFDTINRMYGMIEYENGIVGYIESSKKTSFTQELQVSCNHGILTLPTAWTTDRDITITQRRADWNSNDCEMHLCDGIYPGQAYQLQIENFIAAVRGQARPVVTVVESAVNTFTLEALVLSLQERRAVDIEIPSQLSDAFRNQIASK